MELSPLISDDPPAISIHLESKSDGRVLAEVLSPTPLQPLHSLDFKQIPVVSIALSQTVLVLRVTGRKASVLIDGQNWPLSVFANVATARILLEDDIEHHTISCAVGGSHVLYVEVEVERLRDYGGFSAPKWNKKQVSTAFDRYKSNGAKRAQSRSSFDLAPRWVGQQKTKVADEEILQSLHFAAARFGTLCGKLTRADLLPDYAASQAREIDFDATRDLLRRHPAWMARTADGPIEISGHKYSTTQVILRESSTIHLDLSLPTLVASECVRLARSSSRTSAAAEMLSGGVFRLGKLARLRKSNVRDAQFIAWARRQPRTDAAGMLKALLLQNLNLAKAAADRAHEGLTGIQGLNLGFRDFDLFEWSCCQALCDALQMQQQPLKLASTMSGPRHDLIAVNYPGGAASMARVLRGWRDASLLPSGYLPDFILHLRRETPILIDAKFRVGSIVTDPCSKDGFKEVQAYLDEFGLVGAIILVPSIPASLAAGQPHTLGVSIQGDQNGRGRRVWVVEYAPGLSGFEGALMTAAEDIAASQATSSS